MTIHYKTHIMHNDTSNAAHKNIGQSQVCLMVGILKACGLKVGPDWLILIWKHCICSIKSFLRGPYLYCPHFSAQAAAEALAYTDSGMQYPAEVGVNTYIKVHLSFLNKSVS